MTNLQNHTILIEILFRKGQNIGRKIKAAKPTVPLGTTYTGVHYFVPTAQMEFGEIHFYQYEVPNGAFYQHDEN